MLAHTKGTGTPCSRTHAFLLVILGALALAGCGSDGDTGPKGPPGDPGSEGPPGPSALPDISEAGTINGVITSVSVNSPPVVEFSLSDERGNGLVGLAPANVRFTIAKLVPGVAGNASAWQSYINTTDTPAPGDPGTNTTIQATREGGDEGTLVDNGDGTYQYTFRTDIRDVTSPLPVSFQPNLTHRVGIELRNYAPMLNPTYTFRPSDGATAGLFTRDMVETASCNNCHFQLAEHGGGRRDTAYCVTCHNPGTTDAGSGNTADFKVMIHKIHRGADLPSVRPPANGEYAFYSSRGKTDFSRVEFPQDIRNCRNCHNEANEATPDAGNWIAQPTMEACGSCHDDVNFATGGNHFDGAPAVSNTDCQTCHGAGKPASADKVHALLEQAAAARYQYNIVSVASTAPGQQPVVTFSVTNPQTGAFYDIKSDPPFLVGGGASRLAIDLAWNTVDYTNRGSGSNPALAVSLDPLGGDSVDNGNGTFSMTSGVALPSDLTGTLMVGIEGHPAEDVNGDDSAERLPVRSVVGYFRVTGNQAVARRQVVDIANCNRCHQQLSLHGSNRTDEPQLCVGCHNPNATDINRRAGAGIDESNSADGLKEQSIDFKQMIHGIHAGQIVVYGFGGSLNDFREVEFPGQLNRCTTCHIRGTYYPVNQNLVLATTIDTGASLADSTDDVNISPTASACYGCHRGDREEDHMKINGASFNARQGLDNSLVDNDTNGVVIETCEVCHARGRIADVAVVHGVSN